MDRITFELFVDDESAEDPEPVRTLSSLAERGKLGVSLHRIINHYPNWDKLCGLEDDLIASGEGKGWTLVLGKAARLDEVSGWLEYGGWVVVPYGPRQQEASGNDFGVWSRDEFYEEYEPVISARAPAGDESGILINRQVDLMEQVEAIFRKAS
jgi:hypothetical protein